MNIDNINIEKLEELIKSNYTLASNKRNKIELLTKKESSIDKKDSLEIKTSTVSNMGTITKEIDTEMEEYISLYNSLDTSFTKEELLAVLPDLSNKRYFDIILRLKAESLREIHELYLLGASLDNNDTEEKEEVLSAIEFHEKKMTLLDEINTFEEMVPGEEHKNKLILTPTTGGNIRLIEEMNHIPFEFYPRFIELLDSIVDGTFKNYKRLTSNTEIIRGLAEVKGFQVRVVFARVGVDSYALITAFTKKSDSDNGYISTLKKKVADYKSMKDVLIKNLSNQDFIEENDKNVEELYNILNKNNSKDKKEIKKGGLNG